MGLINEARLDAKAFRENAVYTADGNRIKLGANADRLDAYADALERLKRYADHANTCEAQRYGAECSCGLTALLKEIEG